MRPTSDGKEKNSLKKDTKNTGVCLKKTTIGGQALIEGIMMKSPKKAAMAVRNPQGEIVLEEVETKGAKRPRFCRWPIVRGLFVYIDSMVSGYKCLMRSAEISGLEEAEEEMRREKEAKKAAKAAKKAAKNGNAGAADQSPESADPVGADSISARDTESSEAPDPVGANISAEPKCESPESTEPTAPAKKEKKNDSSSFTTTMVMILGVVLGLGLAILLFKFVPTALYDLLVGLFPVLKPEDVALDSFIRSVIEGVLKIVIVVGYMAAVSLMKEIRRTFRYHGAEHKTIFCYEAGLELTVENVRKQKRFHPRCGTSFLILMVLVNVFVSFFINPAFNAIAGFPMEELAEVFKLLPTIVRTGISLILLPLVMGIGYELLKLAGRYDNIITRLISLPGVWLQHITVLEPDDSMIECAIAALEAVIPEENSDSL